MKKLITLMALVGFLTSCQLFHCDSPIELNYGQTYDKVWDSLEEYFVENEGVLTKNDKPRGLYIISYKKGARPYTELRVNVKKITERSTQVLLRISKGKNNHEQRIVLKGKINRLFL